MRRKEKDPIDATALSKKYKCDIKRIIRAWKNGKNDYELSQTLGIDMLKIMQIRQEITYTHEKARHQKLKNDFVVTTSELFKPR